MGEQAQKKTTVSQRVQLGGVLADKGHLGVTPLCLLLVLQLVVEGEEAGGEVDSDEDEDQVDPHREPDDGALAHLHLLLLVLVHHGDIDRDVSVEIPSEKADNEVDDGADGADEVEDCKDEDTASSLQASPADAKQS